MGGKHAAKVLELKLSNFVKYIETSRVPECCVLDTIRENENSKWMRNQHVDTFLKYSRTREQNNYVNVNKWKW